MEKHGALMQRETHAITIDMNSITAGDDVSIYAMLFAVLALLFLVTWINEYNGIFIDTESTLLDTLADVESSQCADYVYVVFDEWTRMYTALLMGKHKSSMIEAMNAIVAERMSYVDDYIQSFHLNEECRKHIFPTYTPNPKYTPLKLAEFGGVLVFLILFLCVAMFVLLAEMLYNRWTSGRKVEAEDDWNAIFQIHIQLDVDTKFSLDRRKLIFAQYAKLLKVIDDVH